MLRSKIKLLSFFFLVGCSTLRHDLSVDAFWAGDFTLVNTCSAVPGRGMDMCSFTDGTLIETSWKLIVPEGPGILGGEVDVYSRSVHKQYAVKGSIVEIPWAEFFGTDKWHGGLDSEIMALVVVRYKDDTGIIQSVKFRGIAKIVVTKLGYDRMPTDSGFAAWSKTCEIQYSTAGRSALKCR